MYRSTVPAGGGGPVGAGGAVAAGAAAAVAAGVREAVGAAAEVAEALGVVGPLQADTISNPVSPPAVDLNANLNSNLNAERRMRTYWRSAGSTSSLLRRRVACGQKDHGTT